MKTLILTLASLMVVLMPGAAQAGAYEDMEAAMIGRNSSAVIKLIERGMDVNTVSRDGDTLLIQAVRNDIPDLVDALLQRRARLNLRNRSGETALSVAAYMGNMTYVQRIVESGAEINFYGWSPIAYAAFNNHPAIVEYLIKKGAEVNAKTETGATALYLAARNGHTEIVKLLLQYQADPAIATERGETPVDAALKSNRNEIVELLRDAGGRSGKTLTLDLSK